MGVLKTEEVASLYRRYSGHGLSDRPDAAEKRAGRGGRRSDRVPQGDGAGRAFGGPDHERAWLIVTARNECKNQLRHWWRAKRADGTELDSLTWEQRSDGELWELILTLPEHEKMALYLHYYQGYSTGETAELMGQKPSTVRSWLCRARRKLKDLLEEDGEYGG